MLPTTGELVPACGRFFGPGPKFEGTFAGDVAHAKLGGVPATETEGFDGNRHAHINVDHAGTGALGDLSGLTAVSGVDGSRVSVRG